MAARGLLAVDFDGKQAGAKFQFGCTRFAERVGRAAATAATRAGAEIETRGRASMKAGGNFGSARWQSGFKATVIIEKAGIRIVVTHDVPYWRVFEYGAIIYGKPLLWIPLSFANIPPGQNAGAYPGRLFRVNRKSGGAPLLIDPADGQPKYFGIASVRIPQKWNLRGEIRNVAGELRSYYRQAYAEGK